MTEFNNIAEILARNARKWPNDVALVEINPQELENHHTTWREYSLIESSPIAAFRSEITWAEFDEQANRFANFLLSRGFKKGEKVAILLMNCLDWLPIYFGILRAGCMAVPLNFRYTAEEIRYCLDLADADALVFGPAFVGRVEEIIDRMPRVKARLYVGDDCPSFAEPYRGRVGFCSARRPEIPIVPEDDAAIYFSSGTTGFPKAIVLQHRCLLHSCKVEQAHHGQTRDDCFLCIPPLYHTGAKMHWFGSLLAGCRSVLLMGVRPEWILRAVSEERCTIVWLLVPWAQDILDAIERGDVKLSDYRLDQWRLMHIGAQPVPPALVRRWKAVFPHHAYDTNYGLSESTGPGAVHLGVENVDHVGAIGVAGFGWETKIVGPDGVTPVKPGEVGESADRGLHPREPEGEGRRRDRAARRAAGRDRGGHRLRQGGNDAGREGVQRLLPGAAALQASAHGHLRGCSAQSDGQDREAEAAQDVRRCRPRRPAEWVGEIIE